MSNNKAYNFTCEQLTQNLKESKDVNAIQVSYYKMSCNNGDECIMSVDIYPDMGMKSSSLFYNKVYYQPYNPQWSEILLGMEMFGSFVLFPTPNRVKNATYTFGNETVSMQKNGEKRDNHGIVYDSKFAVQNIQCNSEHAKITASLTIDEHDENYKSFPYKCELIITYTLTQNELAFNYEICNLSKKPMPYGIGLHPAFLMGENDISAQIKMKSDCYYETDENLLPTGKKIETSNNSDFNLNEFCDIRNLNLDTVFCLTSDEDTIKFNEHKTQIVISRSEEFKKGILFTAFRQMGVIYGQQLFCVEHQSTCTDAINLYAKGEKDTGLIVLNPGQSKKGFVSYKFENT